MKQVQIILVVLLLAIKSTAFSQVEKVYNNMDSVSIYSNYGVKIAFHGAIDIIENSTTEVNSYFYKAFELVRFNEDKRETDPGSQRFIAETDFSKLSTGFQLDTNEINFFDSLDINNLSEYSIKPEKKNYYSLSTSFSYYLLSTLYIMPKISMKKLIVEIEDYILKNPPYQITNPIKKVKIDKRRVLSWRAQTGKTRLDHYMIFGEMYNYLFVSSPYSSNGVIESVISEMEILK